MGIGNITSVLGTSGSVTAPSSVALTIASALSATIRDFGQMDAIFLPSLRAILFSHGTTWQYHAMDGALYLNGPLAPDTALTADSTATRATMTITFTGDLADGDLIQIGKPGVMGNGYIRFKTTLDTTSTEDQVVRGVNQDDTLQNLFDFINHVGTQGDNWWSGRTAALGEPAEWWWARDNDITATAINTTANTIVFRAVTYGTVGNSYLAREVVDGGGTYSMTGSGFFTGGAIGTGTEPGTGHFTYGRAFFRRADAALTALSPLTGLDQGTNCNVNLTNLTDPLTRDGTDFHRWYRSLTGGSVYYTGADNATSASEPFVDSLSDDTIQSFGHVLTDAGDQARNFRPYTAGYPPHVRCVAHYKGSIIGGGTIPFAKYALATCTVANGSKTVTLATGAKARVDMVGGTFQCATETDEYVINDVSESANTLTLNRGYIGSQTSGTSYTITDKRNRCELFWTPPLLYNNWPVVNSIKGVTSSDPEGVTAIRPINDGAAVFTRTGLYRVYGDPSSGFQVVPVREGCGNYCARSVVDAGGILYWLGPDGAWEWNGEGLPTSISEIEDQQIPRGFLDTMSSISAEYVNGIAGTYNPSDGYVRWAVPVDGEPYNNRILSYNTTNGTASLDGCVRAVTALGNLIGADGAYVPVCGDAYGRIFQMEAGTSEAVYGCETVAAITGYAAATKTVSCSGASFALTLAGAPVLLVTFDGDFYWSKLASNSGTDLVLTHPFDVTPTTSDYVVVGAIGATLASNRFNGGYFEGRRTFSSLRLAFEPSSGRLFTAVGFDSTDPTVHVRSGGDTDYVPLSRASGDYLAWFRRGPGRSGKFEIHDFIPGHETTLVGILPNIPTHTAVVA